MVGPMRTVTTKRACWDGLYAARVRARGRRELGQVEALLFEAVRGEALRIAARVVGLHPADHDDVAQEACLRVWTSFDQCRSEEGFGPWVRAVVRSVACTHRTRHRRHRKHRPADLTAATHGATGRAPVDATVDHRRHLLRLQVGAQGLSPGLRVVYHRTLLGGEDIAATAKALGVQRAVVDQRVRRVRLALAQVA